MDSERFVAKDLCEFADSRPIIQSTLYDLGLLPEVISATKSKEARAALRGFKIAWELQEKIMQQNSVEVK